jgi:hypothetical protein
MHIMMFPLQQELQRGLWCYEQPCLHLLPLLSAEEPFEQVHATCGFRSENWVFCCNIQWNISDICDKGHSESVATG